MALTRLDNLISSKTGKYLYVSPDDFNASDELNNRGNSPIRPFKSLQRAFIEISRFSYVPGIDNDRFDQFTVMVMPGNHYIDNRPGLTSTTGINEFNFDQALSEWNDDSILDLSDPNNILYKFNNTEGGVIILVVLLSLVTIYVELLYVLYMFPILLTQLNQDQQSSM